MKLLLALALSLLLGTAHAATPTFTVSGGNIIGPNGKVFVPRGVVIADINGSLQAMTAADITTAFPGVMMVRIAAQQGYPSGGGAYFAAMVNALTAQGIVVEIGNYALGGVSPTGAALTAEANWYAALATYFINNPYVWFSTANEPQDTSAGLISAEHVAVYNAIRGTGSNAIISIDPAGGFTTGELVASSYTKMTNITWDVHYYNWISNYSTDLAANVSALASEISGIQGFTTSANGTIPVFIGEWGNSTNGASIDPGWTETVQAVEALATGQFTGMGATAFTYWGPTPPSSTGDELFTNGQNFSPPTLANPGLSAYGLMVAPWIKAGPGPVTSAPTPPPPACIPSPNDTVIQNGAGGTILDGSCNKWTVVNGVVSENGALAGYSAGVKEIAVVSNVIWQMAAQWWSWTGTVWTGPVATSPLPATPPPGPVSCAAGTVNPSTMTVADGSVTHC